MSDQNFYLLHYDEIHDVHIVLNRTDCFKIFNKICVKILRDILELEYLYLKIVIVIIASDPNFIVSNRFLIQ